MRENWYPDAQIRFPFYIEATWPDSTCDADVIKEILESEEILDDIVQAAIEASSNHFLFIRIHHWKLRRPLSILSSIDLLTLVAGLVQERTFLERRITW